MTFKRRKKVEGKLTPGIVQITEGYRLNMDKYNVTLEELHLIPDKETGFPKESWQPNGFFSTIPNALRKLVEMQLRESNSLEDMAQRIDHLNSTIAEALGG